MDQPVRRQVAGLLVRVGVAEHHLLPVTAAPDVRSIDVIAKDRVEQRSRLRERRGVLEQRDDVEGHRARLGQAAAARQREHVADVGGDAVKLTT